MEKKVFSLKNNHEFMEQQRRILTLNPIWFAVIFAVRLLSSRFFQTKTKFILSTDQVAYMRWKEATRYFVIMWMCVRVCLIWIIEKSRRMNQNIIYDNNYDFSILCRSLTVFLSFEPTKLVTLVYTCDKLARMARVHWHFETFHLNLVGLCIQIWAKTKQNKQKIETRSTKYLLFTTKSNYMLHRE